MTTKDKQRPAGGHTRASRGPELDRRGRAVRSPEPERKKAAKAPHKPVRRPRKTEDSQIVYTQPPAFSKSGFGIRLLTVAAVVLALTLGMSIFFKVEHVAVSGNVKYTPWDVREASGIQDGENLLTINKAKIVGKIQSQLPYADDIRVGIKLPDTVNIEIVELDVAYAIGEKDAGWWLMTANGKLLEPITAAQAQGYTRILGVEVAPGQVGAQAVAAEEIPEEEDPEASSEATYVPEVSIPPAQQLALAIELLQCLESNGIMGSVNWVDVTYINEVTIRYDDRFDVLVGDSSALDRKIRAMKEAVAAMTDYQTGQLDVSFTTWQDKVIFTPEAEEIS